MMKKTSRISILSSVLLALVLAGCSSIEKSAPPTLYDLGPLHTAGTAPVQLNLPPISIAETEAQSWLNNQAMYFRLAYANDQQPRPYAGSRWTMTPALLFSQRLKARLAQAGGVVLSASDGAADIPLLRLEADDFTQTFPSPDLSTAQVVMRASVFNGRTLMTQKTFSRQAPAPSADAAGGVKAFALASDAMIADMMAWLAQLPLNK
jgi:cholesterol transport system auxiliary component